jgi:hypothetical protein
MIDKRMDPSSRSKKRGRKHGRRSLTLQTNSLENRALRWVIFNLQAKPFRLQSASSSAIFTTTRAG